MWPMEDLVPTSETGSISYVHLDGQKSVRKVGLVIFFIFYCFLWTTVSIDVGYFSRFKYQRHRRTQRGKERDMKPGSPSNN